MDLTMTTRPHPHESVMVLEMVQGFDGASLRVMVDCTLGAGGHSEAILKAHPEIELLIGIDQDPDAIEISRKRLEPFGDRVKLFRANFGSLDEVLKSAGVKHVDGFFLI